MMVKRGEVQKIQKVHLQGSCTSKKKKKKKILAMDLFRSPMTIFLHISYLLHLFFPNFAYFI